jgi:hypothetical protein
MNTRNIKLASLIPSDMRGSFFANNRCTMYSTIATNASENNGLENVKKSSASTMVLLMIQLKQSMLLICDDTSRTRMPHNEVGMAGIEGKERGGEVLVKGAHKLGEVLLLCRTGRGEWMGQRGARQGSCVAVSGDGAAR